MAGTVNQIPGWKTLGSDWNPFHPNGRIGADLSDEGVQLWPQTNQLCSDELFLAHSRIADSSARVAPEGRFLPLDNPSRKPVFSVFAAYAMSQTRTG